MSNPLAVALVKRLEAMSPNAQTGFHDTLTAFMQETITFGNFDEHTDEEFATFIKILGLVVDASDCSEQAQAKHSV